MAIVLVSAIRIRLLQMPLERDEGEFAYMGQLMLQGHAPYSLAYNMKLPGIYAAYAAIMAVFGQTIAGIHVGLLIVNVAAIVMIFMLGRRLFSALAGAAASAAYAVLTIDPSSMGTSAHATHFVVLFALAGILLLLKAEESGRASALVWSGLLLGIAFLMKQPGLVFAIFAAGYLAWTDLRVRSLPWREAFLRLGLFVVSMAAPYAVTCLLLWKAGVFPRFWFWTYEYARVYGTMGSLSDACEVFRGALRVVILPVVSVWALSLAGLVALIWDRSSRRRAGFVLALFALSMAAVSSGLTFRGHYFIFAFPAVSLLVGVLADSCSRLLNQKTSDKFVRVLPALACAIALLVPIAQQWEFFFVLSPNQASRRLYTSNPFVEAVEVAKVIRDHSSPDDLIGIMGSEPEIPFYARRHSATGYLYMYCINEFQPFAAAMRKDMIDQFLNARPRYVVAISSSNSWVGSMRPDLRKLIPSRMLGYVGSDCELVGMVWVDPNNPDNRIYSWKNGSPGKAKGVVAIYKRRDDR